MKFNELLAYFKLDDENEDFKVFVRNEEFACLLDGVTIQAVYVYSDGVVGLHGPGDHEDVLDNGTFTTDWYDIQVYVDVKLRTYSLTFDPH